MAIGVPLASKGKNRLDIVSPEALWKPCMGSTRRRFGDIHFPFKKDVEHGDARFSAGLRVVPTTIQLTIPTQLSTPLERSSGRDVKELCADWLSSAPFSSLHKRM
jgi:hypothetical protein